MAHSAAETLKDNDDDYIILGEAEQAFCKNDLNLAEQLFVLSAERNQLDDKHLVHCFNRLAQIGLENSKFVDAYKYAEASKSIAPDNPDTK